MASASSEVGNCDDPGPLADPETANVRSTPEGVAEWIGGLIADGHIALGGSLPVNTHGGLLGEAYIHGLNNILEAVRQIRGTSVNLVPNAEHVMVAGGRSGMILAKD